VLGCAGRRNEEGRPVSRAVARAGADRLQQMLDALANMEPDQRGAQRPTRGSTSMDQLALDLAGTVDLIDGTYTNDDDDNVPMPDADQVVDERAVIASRSPIRSPDRRS
jgi:hypothetical protein